MYICIILGYSTNLNQYLAKFITVILLEWNEAVIHESVGISAKKLDEVLITNRELLRQGLLNLNEETELSNAVSEIAFRMHIHVGVDFCSAVMIIALRIIGFEPHSEGITHCTTAEISLNSKNCPNIVKYTECQYESNSKFTQYFGSKYELFSFDDEEVSEWGYVSLQNQFIMGPTMEQLLLDFGKRFVDPTLFTSFSGEIILWFSRSVSKSSTKCFLNNFDAFLHFFSLSSLFQQWILNSEMM